MADFIIAFITMRIIFNIQLNEEKTFLTNFKKIYHKRVALNSSGSSWVFESVKKTWNYPSISNVYRPADYEYRG